MSIFVGADQINDVNLGPVGPLGQVYLGSFPLLQSGSGVSPEAQAVLDQMVALSPTEENAIITFVDGLVKDLVWDFVIDCWAPCLNVSDHLTDFKNLAGVLTTIDANQTHIPGQGLDFTAFGAGVLTPGNLSSFMNVHPCGAGSYMVFTTVDTAANTDYFGAVDAVPLECYLRWRGDDTTDINLAWTSTGVTPRPPNPSVRPGGAFAEVIQAGAQAAGASVYFFNGPDQSPDQARTFEGAWPDARMQFNGRNNVGVTQQARESLHSFWFLMQGHNPDTDCITMRGRVLEFLTAIGVTGLPTP